MAHNQTSKKKKVLFFLMLAVFLLISVEMITRLALNIKPLFKLLKGGGIVSFEATQRLQWIQRRRLTTNVGYGFDEHHPLLGWVSKPGIRDMKVSRGKFLNTNSKGIRGITEYECEPPSDKTRILTIGDSFTFGEGVGDDETFSHYLEKMLPDTEVINMGIHGYGHDQILLYFKEEGIKYRPDIVVLGFMYYDMYRNLVDFYCYSKPKFELEAGRLKLKNVPVLSPREMFAAEFFRLKSMDLAKTLYQKLAWKYGKRQEEMERLSEAILNEIAQTARASGAIPVFVYFCNDFDVKYHFDAPPEREAFFLRYCEENKQICTSVRPYFLERLKNGERISLYGHWDEKGHRIAAEAIRDYLVKEKTWPVVRADKKLEARN